ncbi:unnamed protein product [Adineta steineri]|uniref:Uncharacterized protein n=1 Tax=Adineta steineri TaxID=433720 RepID=A0A819H820_9BILA|nr:unnamed protein product [Adineta steineri]CAF0832722.1 unnamed protein product [Adineta steineri]CAF3759887.1 unnamed protein product [Adineta steineri]CAF3892910.1 unnamed protein product [Adineta steineri]
MEQKLSFSQSLNSGIEQMEIYPVSDLITGAKFIVTNGTEQSTDISMYWQCPVDILQRTFEKIKTLVNDSQNFFRDLTNAYANLFNIDLYLIVYNGSKFIIIDKERLRSNERDNHEHYAFLWCDIGRMTYSPVYIQDTNGHKMTKFKTDDVRAMDFIDFHLTNNTGEQPVEEDSRMSEDVSHTMVDTAISSTNDINSCVRQPVATVNARVFMKQMLEDIAHLVQIIIPESSNVDLENSIPDFSSIDLNQISSQMVATLIKQLLLKLSNVVQKAVEPISQSSDVRVSSMIVDEEHNQQRNIVQMNDTNHYVQTDQGSSNVSVHAPIDTSNSDQVSESILVSTSSEQPCEAPSILIQPNSDWHYRSIKDFASNHVPCLSGKGPQRTPIRVTVPKTSAREMYLAIGILTVENEPHPSKVIVPATTTVKPGHLFHDNNLNCLQFDKNSSDYFDSKHRCIYSKISLEEHLAGHKDIKVRMFNLYQIQAITKEIIIRKQLDQCKLSFCLCIFENGEYIPTSFPEFSNIIKETKKQSQSRISNKINQLTISPMSNSDFDKSFTLRDATDEDNIH